jgi:VanZ family protein
VLLSAPPRRVSRSDLLANALLFVPVGFALAGALLADRSRRWLRVAAAALPILGAGLIVSLTAEFLQVFASGRIPSNTDIAAQTLGCAAGITAWLLVGQPLTEWLRASLAARPQDRLARVLMAFVAGWVFVNVAPFDITVDAGDLAERVRSGKIAVVPFSGDAIGSPRWAWDALAEFLAAVPLGLFGLLGWTSARLHRRSTAFAIGTGIVLVVEAAQIFIRSHAATTTDVIFASLGVALGVAIGPRVLAGHRQPSDEASRSMRNPIALGAVALWIVVLCAYHWVPYDFTMDTEAIRRKLGRMSLLPFAGYRSGSYLNALNNLLTKTALALPLGVAAAYVVRPGGMSRALVTGGAFVFGVGVFGAIETGQFFLPGRFPDPTDVLVGALAVVAGLRLGSWLRETR